MSGPILYFESVKCLSIMHEPTATAASAISGPILWSEKPINAFGNAFLSSVIPKSETISGGDG